MLQQVRRVISLLESIEGEDAVGPPDRAAQYFIGLELWRLRALANKAPLYCTSDAKLAAVRLILLIKALPIFRRINEYNCTMIFDEATWESFVNVMASPAGIARLKKIGGLLETAEPVVEGGDANAPTGATKDLSLSNDPAPGVPCSESITEEDLKFVSALYDLGAFDRKQPVKIRKALDEAGIEGHARGRNIQLMLARLKKNLIETRRGCGAWLTPTGKTLAETLSHKSHD
jgi:hypothetical protein